MHETHWLINALKSLWMPTDVWNDWLPREFRFGGLLWITFNFIYKTLYNIELALLLVRYVIRRILRGRNGWNWFSTRFTFETYLSISNHWLEVGLACCSTIFLVVFAFFDEMLESLEAHARLRPGNGEAVLSALVFRYIIASSFSLFILIIILFHAEAILLFEFFFNMTYPWLWSSLCLHLIIFITGKSSGLFRHAGHLLESWGLLRRRSPYRFDLWHVMSSTAIHRWQTQLRHAIRRIRDHWLVSSVRRTVWLPFLACFGWLWHAWMFFQVRVCIFVVMLKVVVVWGIVYWWLDQVFFLRRGGKRPFQGLQVNLCFLFNKALPLIFNVYELDVLFDSL